MITVREIPEPGTYDPFEDGLLLPIPTEERNGIVLEPRDGSRVRRIAAKAVTVELDGKRAGSVEDVRLDVYITDARVALACSKYDKGGGWVGSPGTMLVLNVGSKALAAMRRRGKMLVGQARYPWLTSVGSTTKFGWLTEERLVLGAKGPQGPMRLVIQLDKEEDAAGLAAEITCRAAAHRLASELELDAEVRANLEKLAQAKRLEPDPNEKDTIKRFLFPSPRVMGEESARLRVELAARTPRGEAFDTATQVSRESAGALAHGYCGRCGKALDSVALFCGMCGEPVSERSGG